MRGRGTRRIIIVERATSAVIRARSSFILFSPGILLILPYALCDHSATTLRPLCDQDKTAVDRRNPARRGAALGLKESPLKPSAFKMAREPDWIGVFFFCLPDVQLV